MPDISIQFHALPEEVFPLVSEAMRDFGVKLVAIRLRPFEVKRIDSTGLGSLCAERPKFNRLGFVLGEPDCEATNELEFADRNPDWLRLDIGAETEKGLEQSWLSAMTENPEAIAIWKKIATRIKKITKQGVTAVNPDTGATCAMKSFRYTEKAKKLADRGVRILPIAGGTLLRFEESRTGPKG